MRVSFYTLGCKVNQNETGALEQLFCRSGYTLAGPGEAADVYVVNSCTVTAGGDKKSRQWLRRAKREAPGAVTVLAGCYPQAFPAEAAAVAEADVVVGNAARQEMLSAVERALATGERVVDIRSRSRAQGSILAELQALGAAGYKEVVLSGINLPSYGKDTGADLTGLIEACAGVAGIERIRLGSLEPDLLTDRDIARMAACKKLCPQFHLSLQSGCEATLRRMRRTYTAAQYALVVDKLRAAYGGAASFTTDVIVGFPGETEADFCESMAFVERQRFLKVHVFPYSSRPGTPAASFPGQLPEAEKAARVHRLQTLADGVRAGLIGAMLGARDEVLLEKPLSSNLFTGYTRLYVPVAVKAPGGRPGQIVTARLQSWDGERCRAEALPG